MINIKYQKGNILLITVLLVGIVVGSLLLNIIMTKVFAQATPPVQPPTQVGTFKGYVQVDRGVRMAGVKVILNGTSLSAITDSDGNFTINNVPVGKFLVINIYKIDPNLPAGTGGGALSDLGSVGFGAYIPKAGDIIDLGGLGISSSTTGAP